MNIDKIKVITFLRTYQSYILFLSVLTYYFKTAFWPLTFIFIPAIVLFVCIYLLNFKKDFWLRIKIFFQEFRLPFLLATIFIIEYLCNGNFSNTIVLKDFFLILVLFSIFYFLYWNSYSENKLSYQFVLNSIIIISAIIAFVNLIIQLLPNILPVRFFSFLHITLGQSVALDYNYFCLFMTFGLIALVQKSSWQGKIVIPLAFLFFLNIILSGSRRGIIVLVILVFAYSILILKKRRSKVSPKELIIICISACLLLLSGTAVFLNLPKSNKQQLISRYRLLTGSQNIIRDEKIIWRKFVSVKSHTNCLLDSTFFGANNDFWKSYAKASSLIFVKSKYGNSVELSMKDGDMQGFALQYAGPKILYYSGHTYNISFKIKFIKGNFDSFNVGWWVNDGDKGFQQTAALQKQITDLKDGWFHCSSKYTFIDNHYNIDGFINSVADETSFIISDFKLSDLNYDENLPKYIFQVKSNKNLSEWINKINPELRESNLVNNGKFKQDLAFWMHTSDSTITHEIKKFDDQTCLRVGRTDGNEGDWSLFYNGRSIRFLANDEYQIQFKLYLPQHGKIPFKVGFWVDEGEGPKNNLLLHIDTLEGNWLNVKANCIFKYDHDNLLFPINSQVDNSEFLITDLRLINLSEEQTPVATIPFNNNASISPLFSDRLDRWKFASELWKTNYKWNNKLIGHGHDYLKWYGDKFNFNMPDWPHNPFITIMLYSGLIGLVLYILLIIKSIRLYFLYCKKYKIAFLGFALTFFFTFFSGGNPFDPPIMGFFVLFPFLIRSIYIKNYTNATNPHNWQQ